MDKTPCAGCGRLTWWRLERGCIRRAVPAGHTSKCPRKPEPMPEKEFRKMQPEPMPEKEFRKMQRKALADNEERGKESTLLEHATKILDARPTCSRCGVQAHDPKTINTPWGHRCPHGEPCPGPNYTAEDWKTDPSTCVRCDHGEEADPFEFARG